jgi:hypothetical protein
VSQLLIDRVRAAAGKSRVDVARELADDGSAFDVTAHGDLIAEFVSYPKANLFLKCIVHTAHWAGFVGSDPAWPADGIRFLEFGTPYIKQQYRSGFHGKANPIAYLETWQQILGDQNVPGPPDGTSSAHDLVRFHHDAFACLKTLDWKNQRSWLGPWTFHGAFKLYVLHEQRLWADSSIDAVTMPMGGADGTYSFERGWEHLHSLGVVPAMSTAATFSAKMVVADQVHAEVQALASLAGNRAVHVNSDRWKPNRSDFPNPWRQSFRCTRTGARAFRRCRSRAFKRFD